MLLSKDSSLFEEITKETSEHLKVLDRYVEKDFYAISILKELVSRNENFVFKGGTSLSVCQKIIERFSEDIDISYLNEHITVGERRRIKEAFISSIESVGLTVSNLDNIRSRRIFNRYLCPYISKFNGKDDKVIVEWATQTPSFPVETKTAQTLIGQYLTKIGRSDLVEKYSLEPFEVKTITKERTFVDKVFAICDYHISKKLERQSRHIYDLHHLLKVIKLDESVIDIFNKVKEYRINLDTCYSVKTEKKISDYLSEIISEGTYLNDYRNNTYPLLYDHIPYEEAILSLKTIISFLKKYGY